MTKVVDESLISKAFDGEQKDVVIKLADCLGKLDDGMSEKAIFDALEKRGIDKEVFGLSDIDRAALKLKKQVANTKKLWDNNGYMPGVRDRMELKDLIEVDQKRREEWMSKGKKLDGVFSTDQPLLLPRVIEETIRLPIEPNLVLTPLLKKISVPKAGAVITFPAIGNAMTAADIPEGGEYPEGSFEMAGEVTAKMGKSGIALKVTEEMVRYSMYDVISMHLQAATRALMRWKEEKVAKMIFEESGTTFFNNSVSTTKTGGRDATGVSNNTITLDDILLMYADMVNEGFIPDTMIVHPFAWYGFARDPIMRHLFMQGQGGFYYQTFQGNIGSPNGAFAGGGLNTTNYFSDPAQVATTYQVPSILPTPMQVIVTPFQTADVAAGTSTITICQRSELGMLLEDESLSTDEWNDPARDIRKIKLRERYALAVSSNGTAIRHAKGVSYRNKPYSIDDRIVGQWTFGSGALPTITQPSI